MPQTAQVKTGKNSALTLKNVVKMGPHSNCNKNNFFYFSTLAVVFSFSFGLVFVFLIQVLRYLSLGFLP